MHPSTPRCRGGFGLTWQAFDITRKVTYQNLTKWYQELQEMRPGIPVIVVANKIDRMVVDAAGRSPRAVDWRVTKKSFNFAAKRKLPFAFVSASEGTNVVKVFREAIRLGKVLRGWACRRRADGDSRCIGKTLRTTILTK